MSKIYYDQEKILKTIKKLFFSKNKLDKKKSLSEFYYFASWSDNYGKWCLKKILGLKTNFLKEIYSYLRFALEYSIKDSLHYITKGKILGDKFKNLIITYSNSENLEKKKLYDQYFSTKINSSKKTLWIIINFDKKNFNLRSMSNVIVIQKNEKIYFLLNPRFYLLFFKNLALIIFFKKKIFDYVFFNYMNLTIKKILHKNEISNVYMPFESKPHQHAIIKTLKENNKNIKVFGFIHSTLSPLPTDYFFKKYYEPDKLVANGESQKNILEHHLAWPKKKLLLKNSFRFQKKNKKKFSNKIFLSYSIGDPNKAFLKIRHLINDILKIKFSFKVINHPFMKYSSSHKKLIGHINHLKKISHLKKNNGESIVVGVSTVILEILENGKDVFHICEDPIFHVPSNKIWKKIIVKKVDKGIYHYSLKFKGSLIKFGKKNSFKKSFDI